MNLTALIQERAALNARIQELAGIDAATGMNAEQTAEFTESVAKLNALTARIDRARTAEAAAASAAVSVDVAMAATAAAASAAASTESGAGAGAATSAASSHFEPTFRAKREPGTGVAHMARALAATKGDPRRAAEFAEASHFGADVAAALNTGTSTAGGILIPSNLAAEVIELLRPKTVVRRLGALSMPLPNGNLTIPRLKGGAIVGYIGTDSDIPATEEQFDDLKLTAKKMAAIVPISNDLLKYSGINPNVDRVVSNDLVSAIGAREDKAFIRDDGTANTPKGLRSWALPANIIHAPSLTGLEGQDLYNAIDQALGALILLLENANSGLGQPGWIMAPRTKRFLADFRDGNGNKFFPELAQGQLKGYPVGSTTQVPWNLGVGANESEIYFVDFADCFIGEGDDMRMDYSSEATYKDGEGNVISAFQRDQTLVRVIATNDFGPRHVESIAVMDQVKWGVAA